MMIAVCEWEEVNETNYLWRRLQSSEQQAQRQKKNVLQKALVFARRTWQLVSQPDTASHKEIYQAWMKAVDEYNGFDAALSNDQLRISRDHAEQLFSFKVPYLNSIHTM